MESIIRNILKENEWIVEGVSGWWTERFAEKSDLIIFLDLPFRKIAWRNIKRYFFENEKRPNENLKNLLRLIKYVKSYKKDKHEGSYHHHKDVIANSKKQIMIINKKSEINKLLKKFQ